MGVWELFEQEEKFYFYWSSLNRLNKIYKIIMIDSIQLNQLKIFKVYTCNMYWSDQIKVYYILES